MNLPKMMAACAACTTLLACANRPTTGSSEGSSPPPLASATTPAKQTGHDAGPSADPTVWFEPLDMMTSTGDTVPRIAIVGSMNRDADAEFVLLHSALRTWPELTSVTTATAKRIRVPADEQAGPASDFITYEGSLPDRWYVLVLDSLPPGHVVPPGFPVKRFEDGSLGVRFRPGSEAVVSAIRTCPKSAERTYVVIDFSERVLLTESSLGGVVHSTAGSSWCEAPFPAADSSRLHVEFQCGPLGERSRISVGVGAGTSMAAKTPITGPRDFSDLDPTTLPMWGGCHVYRP